MPSIKDLGKRLKSVSSTSKITKAMKMVAASKLRKAEVLGSSGVFDEFEFEGEK